MSFLKESLPDLPICIDVETISCDDGAPAFEWHKGHRVSGFAIAQWQKDKHLSCYLPIRHRTESVYQYDDVVGELREFANQTTRLINHNIKFDLHFMRMDGIEFPIAELIDTMVLARLYNCTIPELNLDYLSKKFCKQYQKEGDPVKDWLEENKSMDYGAVPIPIMSRYAQLDSLSTIELAYTLGHRMQAEGYDMRPWEVEKKLTRVLYDSEASGVDIDKKYLLKKSYDLLKVQAQCVERLQEICGEDFDPGSDLHKRQYFHSNNIHTTNLTKGGPIWQKNNEPVGPEHESFAKSTLLEIINEFEMDDGELDTDEAKEEALKRGDDPRSVAWWLITYNREQHHYSTFCDGWLQSMPENESRIYVSYRQGGTRSGRLSMGKPSLHNYPPWVAEAILIPEGYIGVEWDASQIEYRIFAHFAGQAFLYEAYEEDAKLDFHQLMADKIGIPRKPSKTLNFATLYGIGQKKMIKYLTQFIIENDTPELRSVLLKHDPNVSTRGSTTPRRC